MIVPVYNCEKYLSQALDSILNQTYKNLEILVIDDGSTDGSPAICDKYAKDSRVKVFHRQNSGLSASRQFGIDNCTGAYFITTDSDDYVSDDYVEKLYAAIKKNNADIAVCGVSCFADGSKKIGAVYMPNCAQEKLAVTKELLSTDFRRMFEDFILTDSWNKMHRTQFVRDTKVKYVLSNRYVGQDMWFELKLVLHCPVYCTCSEAMLYHRKHQGGMMAGKNINWQEGFELTTDSLIEDSRLLGIPLKNQLTEVYYGMLGILILNIFFYGGGIKNVHASCKALVERNKSFMEKTGDKLEHFNGFKTFKLSKYPMPMFILGNALWLDAAILSLRLLYKIKSK